MSPGFRASLAAVALLAGPLAGGFAGSARAASPSTNTPTQAELDAGDTDPASWLTYNKGYLGYRYAPLAGIGTANVAQVKVLCSANLGVQTHFESGLVAYGGMLYVTAGLGTYAIDAGSCATRWSYTYPATQGGGEINRGVSVAGGRLFRGTGNGHLIALDRATGALLWDRQVTDFSIGELLTGAPIAWNGLVFVGKAGGDRGIQGEILALRQSDGTQVWGFHTVPDPGQTGSATWPTAFSLQHGGGATWSSFALDEARGLLLVPVGNPGPDDDHAVRKGINLFTDSIVALDASTGALSWYHQLLHGEARDWDTTVVSAFRNASGFDTALAAGKDGVLHAVDRSDGKLRYTVPLVENYLNTNTPVPMGKGIRICPVQAVQWNGPSYSPATATVYMTGIDWCTQAIQGKTPVYQPDQPYTGWANGVGGTRDPIGDAFGLLDAIDGSTGALKWRTRLPALPLGGVVATAGGLVIAGGIDGNVVFVNATSGSVLGTVNVGQPIGGGIVSFSLSGQQRIAVAAGMVSANYETSGTATIAVLGVP